MAMFYNRQHLHQPHQHGRTLPPTTNRNNTSDHEEDDESRLSANHSIRSRTTTCTIGTIQYEPYLDKKSHRSHDSWTCDTIYSSESDTVIISNHDSGSVAEYESNIVNQVRSVTDDLLGSLSHHSIRNNVFVVPTNNNVQPCHRHAPNQRMQEQPSSTLFDEEAFNHYEEFKKKQQQRQVVAEVEDVLTPAIKDLDEDATKELIHLEIFPGVMAPFYGADETLACIETDSYTTCSCMGCDTFLFCISKASHVICPKCNTVSMNEDNSSIDRRGDDINHTISVGLGFTIDQLGQWQQSILNRHQPNQRSTQARSA